MTGATGGLAPADLSRLSPSLLSAARATVTACHYPKGCSEWKPIEHRLFSQISLNCAGKPLRSLETMLNARRGTTTSIGLTVRAVL
jgi:hypothetical protein